MLTRPPLQWLRALIWVLCLALPLQAAAVVGMAGCGPLSLPQQGSSEAAGAAHHEHSNHAAAGASVQSHEQAQQPHDDHAPGDKAQAQRQCSACAACFVGAALPCAAVLLPAPAGHAVQHGVPAWASLSCCGARLDRPPRAAQA